MTTSLRFGPEACEGAGNLLLAGEEAVADGVTRGGDTLVQVQVRELGGEAPLYLFKRIAACGGMARLDDVEEVGIYRLVNNWLRMPESHCNEPVERWKRR